LIISFDRSVGIGRWRFVWWVMGGVDRSMWEMREPSVQCIVYYNSRLENQGTISQFLKGPICNPDGQRCRLIFWIVFFVACVEISGVCS
jgi:hypothetical protein